VDQKWGDQPAQVSPAVPIQSHVANARTNPKWFYRNNGHSVQGRLWWDSPRVRGVIEHVEGYTEQPKGTLGSNRNKTNAPKSLSHGVYEKKSNKDVVVKKVKKNGRPEYMTEISFTKHVIPIFFVISIPVAIISCIKRRVFRYSRLPQEDDFGSKQSIELEPLAETR